VRRGPNFDILQLVRADRLGLRKWPADFRALAARVYETAGPKRFPLRSVWKAEGRDSNPRRTPRRDGVETA
jgi:hypothetical protein